MPFGFVRESMRRGARSERVTIEGAATMTPPARFDFVRNAMPMSTKRWLLLGVLVGACLIPFASRPESSSGSDVGLAFESCIEIEFDVRRPCDLAPFSPSIDSKLVFSPDGRSAYTSSSPVLMEYSRSRSGALEYERCSAFNASEVVPSCSELGRNVLGRGDMVVSPDGDRVYQTTLRGTVATYLRRSDGSLSLAGCSAARGVAGCATVPREVGPVAEIEVSRDGRHVYVSSIENGVAVYRQPERGALKFQSCVSTTGRACGRIRHGKADFGGELLMTPNGRTLFRLSSYAISVFSRDAKGNLKPKGCLGSGWIQVKGCRRSPVGRTIWDEMVMGPWGNRLHVMARGIRALVTFRISRDGSLGFERCLSNQGRRGCESAGKLLNAPISFLRDPAGTGVYVNVAGDTLERYAWGKGGRLRYRGCLSTATYRDCAQESFLGRIWLNAISPDGQDLYFNDEGGWWVFGKTD